MRVKAKYHGHNRRLRLPKTLEYVEIDCATDKIVRAQPDPLPEHYSIELQFLVSRLLDKSADARPTAEQVDDF